jgi:predicted nucleic acid-binding protein
LIALSDPVFVLDAQALSLLAEENRAMMLKFEIATRDGYAPVLSAITVAEQRRTGAAAQRMRWLRSRLTVVDITEEVADRAAELLEAAELDGHECVVDALVVAVAAIASGPAKVASSDGSHIPSLCKAASIDRPSPVEWIRV